MLGPAGRLRTMKDLGAEHLAGDKEVKLHRLLSFYPEQEQRFQHQEKGLSLYKTTNQTTGSIEVGKWTRHPSFGRELLAADHYWNDNTLYARLRNATIKDLRSLTFSDLALKFCSG